MNKSRVSDWKQVKLQDVIIDIKDGGTPPRSNAANFGGGIHWCVVKDIQRKITKTKETLSEQGLNSCSARVWPVDSVIISLGATIGKVGIAKVPVATKQGLSGIVVDNKRILPDFLYYVLVSKRDFILSLAGGTTIKEIRPSKLKVNLIFDLPSLDEQNRIVELLDKQMAVAEQALAAANEQLEAIEAMPAALLRQVFGDLSTPPPLIGNY